MSSSAPESTAAAGVELRPLNADFQQAAAVFAARIPERDKGFMDPFLFYQVTVSSWTRATPARRIAAVEMTPDVRMLGVVAIIPGRGWQSHVGEFRIVVLPEARGRGVGQELIARGLALAHELNLLKVTIQIMASNAAGLALFERNGFRRAAVLARHVRDGNGDLQDLVVLSRELEQLA